MSVYLQAVTMIDPATGWIEIRTVPLAWTYLVANQVELAWLTCYPLSIKIIVDRGNEFLALFRAMIINDCSITVKPITSTNPQANAILERVHQTIGNILSTFKVQNMVLDDKNPWDGILATTVFAVRATVHTTTQYTPAQLIFGRDSIRNQRHNVDSKTIRKQKQNFINIGMNVKIVIEWITRTNKETRSKFNLDAYMGPYVFTAVRNNGTVRDRKVKVTDNFNIRNLTSYKE